jgi:hypothetical protein
MQPVFDDDYWKVTIRWSSPIPLERVEPGHVLDGDQAMFYLITAKSSNGVLTAGWHPGSTTRPQAETIGVAPKLAAPPTPAELRDHVNGGQSQNCAGASQ